MPRVNPQEVETIRTSKHQTSSKIRIHLRHFVVVLFLAILDLPGSSIAIESGNAPIQTYGIISYPTSNVNLAVIPDGWHLTFGPGPQIIFLDYNFVHSSGNPSVRLEPHTSADINAAREVNGHWLSVKPGDHIVAKCWIYCGDSSIGDTDPYHGARLGMDLYTHAHTAQGGVYGIVDSYPHSGQEHLDCMIRWGSKTWTQKVWDIIVPSTFYTQVKVGTVRECDPVQIDSFVLWLQVLTPTDLGLAWFADAELYINPG